MKAGQGLPVTFVAIWAAILFITKTEFEINWEAIRKFPEVVTIYTILYLLFAKWAWRWTIFQGWLVPYPDLQGTWEGTLESTWTDKETGNVLQLIPAILVIKQSFSSLSCTMHTQESISYSKAAVLREDEESGSKELNFSYTNTPRVTVRDRSIVHDGAATLRIISSPERSVRGEYWTNRKTTGEISLRFRSRELLEAFSDDLKSKK